MFRFISINFLFIVLFISACSSSGTKVLIPDESESDLFKATVNLDESVTDHTLLGLWTARFDNDFKEVLIIPNRDLDAHLNVTSIIPPPSISVNEYNPVTNVIDVDVKLTNPFTVSAYDIRLIIFLDETYHLLLNPDNWTPLYDVPGGDEINPFKAYAKDEPNRIFAGHAQHTENLLIYLPQGNTDVLFAVDASYPSNCAEPYEISNFQQENLVDALGASAWMYVDVFDWQDDIDNVIIRCPEITGNPEDSFTYDSGNTWKIELFNITGAGVGEYPAYIHATSSGSGTLELVQPVIVTVNRRTDIPYNPHIVGRIHYVNGAENIEIIENKAYLASGSAGMQIININDITNPDLIGGTAVDSYAGDVAIQENYAYVVAAREDNEFKVFDISDKRHARLITEICIELDQLYAPYEVYVSGNLAYVYLRLHYILILIDIRNPANPQMVAVFTYPEMDCWGITVSGDYAFAASSFGLTVIDVSNPVDPQIVKIHTDFECFDIDISGNLAYLCGWESLDIVDISDPMNPVLTGKMDTVFDKLEVSGNYACLQILDETVKIVDISDPSDPVMTGEFICKAGAFDISGDLVIVSARETGGLHFLDISDPYTPFAACYLKMGSPRGISVSDNLACIANKEGLMIADITSPEYPEVNSILKNVHSNNVIVSDNYAYVSCTNAELNIVEITDPANPEVVSTVHSKDGGNGIFFEKNQGFVAVGYYENTSGEYPGGLELIDVNDPVHPINMKLVQTDYLSDVVIKNNYAYVVSPYLFGALSIVGVHDPRDAFITAMINTGVQCHAIDRYDKYVYIAHDCSGVCITDVSDVYNPQIVASIDINGCADDVVISDNFAYVTVREQGLKIYDLTNPVNPSLFSKLDIKWVSESNYNHLTLNNNYAYMTCWEGVYIIKLW